MNKYFLYIISVLFLVSCGGSQTKSDQTQQKNITTYYLENDLHSEFNINGNVKSLSEQYINRKTDTARWSTEDFNMRPLIENIAAKGYMSFNTAGMCNIYFNYLDSLSYVNEVRKHKTPLIVYKSKFDSLPQSLHYTTDYSMNIIHPRMLKPNRADKLIPARKIERPMKFRYPDSLYYENYHYIIKDGKLRQRIRRDLLPNGNLIYYNTERVKYAYNKKGEIIRQSYNYYELVDSTYGDIEFKDHLTYHDVKVPGRATMQQRFSYDSTGRESGVKFLVNGQFVFGENYTYAPDGHLASKEQTDIHWRGSWGHRSYRTVYTYDKRGNITHVVEHNRQGKAGDELWVDYYNFDDHGNWQRCEMFLDNTHKGKPQLTGYRKYTYYKQHENSPSNE